MKKGFIETVSKMDPDILCLQETKASQEQIFDSLSALKNYHIYPNVGIRKGYSGTVILSKVAPKIVNKDLGIKEHDTEGRLIKAEFDKFNLITVYTPNSGQRLERLDYRQKWDQDFLNYLKEQEKQKPLIVCGDFNVAHQPIDLKNDKANYNKTAGYTQVEIDGMNNLINSGFTDTFRYFHPDEVAYTYWSYRFSARERNIGWRIDYLLVSASLLPKIEKVEILSEIYGSDHCPIKLEIAF